MVVGDSLSADVETVDNSRWLKARLAQIAGLQKGIARGEAKQKSGKERGFPANVTLNELYKRLRHLHAQIARQRKDFYHKLTAAMVARFGLIVTEQLAVKNMNRAPKTVQNEDGTYAPNGAAAKAGLNRGIVEAAPAGMLDKFRYKAEEAGSKFMEIPTKKVEPSDRRRCCGKVTEHTLAERTYRCACGNVQDRDANASRTMLRYAYEGAWWEAGRGPGTGLAADRLACMEAGTLFKRGG